MKLSNNRILVGMSGGIDSTATCLMLREQGYEVVGLTMWVWGDEPTEARRLAESMGMEHHTVDERDGFRQTIVRNFIDEYRQGRTPNPCVLCNPLFKFRILTEWADRLGCAHIATGHYVRTVQLNSPTNTPSRLPRLSGESNPKGETHITKTTISPPPGGSEGGCGGAAGGSVFLLAGIDEKKDQSYFLWRLGQEVLRRCVFPLGTLTKQQVRDYLRSRGYNVKADEGESMEVCFIRGDYRDFLREQAPEIDREVGAGWFVNSEGVKLGQHKGFPYYTVGQRKGLEIALGKPAYVLKINPQKNTVMLGDAEQLKAEYMIVEQEVLADEAEFFGSKALTVRIRYRSRPLPCTVSRMDDGRLLVHFLAEASAIAPGQSAVFYVGRRVVGGALIASQRGIGQWIK